MNEHQSEWSSGLNKITSIMGTTLNGFIEKFKWEGLGQAIGGSIKTALEAETNFFKTVNWVNLGKGLSSTLNSAIETGVLQSYFKSMASKLRAAIETAFGAITTFKFDKLGEALGQGINDFFATMNEKNKDTKLTGWQELGKSISDGIIGIATSITTALETVDWKQVGQAIADFIGAIDWGGVVWSLGKKAKALIKAIGETITAQTKEDPVSGIITIGILGFTLRKGWKKLLAILLGSKIGKSKISVGLSRVFAVIKYWSISKVSKIAKPLGSKIKSGVGKLTVTFKNGYAAVKNWIANGAKISDLIKAVKKALGIQKGLTLSNIAVKIATKLPTFLFPDPTTDDIVRQIDEGLGKFFENVPGYDPDLGIFSLPKALLVNIPIEIGNFVLTGGLVDAADNAIKTLQGWFNKLMGNDTSKTPTVKANVNYNADEKSVKEVKNKIPKSKSVKVTANAKKGKDFDKTKKDYDDFKTKNANIKLNIKGADKLKEIAKNPLLTDIGKKDKIKRSVEITFKMKNQLTDSVSNLLSNLGKNSKSSKPKKKAKGGIFENGSWHNITKYASGGMPNMGQLFVAREKGPELVSTLKGHTAVMNNDQIVASVSQGVSDAVYNVMTPVLTSLVSSINRMNSNGTPLYVEGVSEGDIVKITQNANADYKKRYGKPLFT